MCAVYAFFRDCDDISDDKNSTDRRQNLEKWRQIIMGAEPSHEMPGLLAFRDAVQKYSIPLKFFSELIDGTLMDIDEYKYKTYQDTYKYCYHVASTVGLVCVHIFGFEEKYQAEIYRMAETQGIAFQLTNIMRDISEDCSLNRCYLPSEMLEKFGITAEDINSKSQNSNMIAMYDHMSKLIASYYNQCSALPKYIYPESRACLRAMTMIYRGIAKKIEKLGPKALNQRARLTKLQKLVCVLWGCLYSSLEMAYYKLKLIIGF